MTLAEARRRLAAPAPLTLPFCASIDGPGIPPAYAAEIREARHTQAQLARATMALDEMSTTRALHLEARAAGLTRGVIGLSGEAAESGMRGVA